MISFRLKTVKLLAMQVVPLVVMLHQCITVPT